MKIGIYSTQIIPTSPDLDEYGGLELIAGLQAKYFDDLGHEIHLFGCKNSYFSKNKDGSKQGSDHSHLYIVGNKGTNPVMAWKTYWDDPRTRKVLKECDIICDHSWNWYPYSVHNELKHICHIEHGPNPSFRTKPPVPHPNMIAVGFNQAKWMMKIAPGLTWRAVQNGIPLWKYNLNKKPFAERERLLWISRLYYPKGAHRAIKIAENLKMPIDIAGGSFGQIKEYEILIKDMCNKSEYANFLGPVSFDKKLELYSNAKCVILPIVEFIPEEEARKYMNHGAWEWHEPLGLVTPEAGACGTPTIVTPNGGWQESMIHGFNGFFANTNKEFEYFVKQVVDLKPENCRFIAEKFDYKVMCENYLRIFKEILDGGGGW